MISINITTSNNPDFISLSKLLDQELLQIYKSEQAKYDEYNVLETSTKSIVIYDNQTPVACGAFREIIEHQTIEIKRMFVFGVDLEEVDENHETAIFYLASLNRLPNFDVESLMLS